MANSGNNKEKLLYLLQIFTEQTDEDHPLTMSQIIEKMEAEGYPAERKAVSRDMKMLSEFGYEIQMTEERVPGYYLVSREFEISELKLLADAVAASRLITQKQSQDILQKLEHLTSKHNADQLKRQIIVPDRAQIEKNASIYAVDTVFACIEHNHMLSFKYMEWVLRGTSKELVQKRDGEDYIVSPLGLLWDNQRYYLIAYSERDAGIRHYRVDKMQHAVELDDNRNPDAMRLWSQTDTNNYTNRTFGMFAGKEEMVGLTIPEYMVGVFIDRFGTEIAMRSVAAHKENVPSAGTAGKATNQVAVRVPVEVSAQFFGWLTGLGSGITITSPEEVKDEYKKYLQEILGGYES